MRWWMLGLMMGCAGSDTDEEPVDTSEPLEIGFPDFESREGDCELQMPVAFECDNANPTVTFSGGPADAAGLVLIFDDPDAGDYPHWAMWDIPAGTTQLDAGISGDGVTNAPPSGAKELVNGFGWEGYLGSCPGSEHTYRWTVWAVDDSFSFTPSGGAPNTEFAELREAAQDASLERARGCHVYGPASQ